MSVVSKDILTEELMLAPVVSILTILSPFSRACPTFTVMDPSPTVCVTKLSADMLKFFSSPPHEPTGSLMKTVVGRHSGGDPGGLHCVWLQSPATMTVSDDM